MGFFSDFSLPYVAGNAYTPTSEIMLASGQVGSFPLEIFLRLERNRDGLIVYDICAARGDLLGIGLGVVVAILIALIIILLGGKIDLPLPIPQPTLGLFSPDETPAPDTSPPPEAIGGPGKRW